MYRNKLISTSSKLIAPAIVFTVFGIFLYSALQLVVEALAPKSSEGIENEDSSDLASFDVKSLGASWVTLGITSFALGWPYIKCIGLLVAWFIPTSLLPRSALSCCKRLYTMNFEFRGHLLHFLDYFGKWSLAESYLVLFVKIMFDLSIGIPETDLLEDEEYFRFNFSLALPPNVYIFAGAVLASILASNILVYLHEKINTIREMKQNEIAAPNFDHKLKVSILDWKYKCKPQGGYRSYHLRLTKAWNYCSLLDASNEFWTPFSFSFCTLYYA